jgi:uncharacterized protein (TIGR03083 family)
MEYWVEIERERRDLVDQVQGLSEEQWKTPSLCGAWTVRDVVAHLLSPLTPGVTRRFALAMVKARGNFDRANQLLTAGQARLSTPELLAGLRRHAASRFHPPGLGSEAPLTDVLVHGLDIRIPLGLDTDRPADAWRSSLTFLCGPEARKGFINRPLPGLILRATDVDLSAPVGGGGHEVIGPASALALTLLGRTVWLDHLDGPGVSVLSKWATDG